MEVNLDNKRRLGFDESKPHYLELDRLQKKYFTRNQTVVQRKRSSIPFLKAFQEYLDANNLTYYLGGFYEK